MAPTEEIYFPSLEKCFSGDSQLISWKQAYFHICADRTVTPDDRYFTFLTCDDSTALLSQPSHGFPSPSSQTKSSFETKTAAINIAPSANGQYQIEDIKEDALWLAKEAKLDELAALRIAVLEWQQRPVTELQTGFAEAEIASLRESLGDEDLGSVISVNKPILDSQSEAAKSLFLSTESRRQRLLELYLGERESILCISEKIISGVISGRISSESGAGGATVKSKPRDQPTTYQELGTILWDAHKRSTEHYALSCIEAIETRVHALERGSGWTTTNIGSYDIEQAWTTTNLHEIIQIMNLMLLNLRSDRRLTKSTVLLAWMKFVAKHEFFTRFQAQVPAQVATIAQLQSSVVLASLAILDVSGVISYILDKTSRTQVEQDTDDHFLYFFDLSNISEIHEIFLSTASACIVSAGPAVFAWGMVLYTIRELGLSAKEAREGYQVQKAIDQGISGDSPSGRRLSSSSVGSSQQSIYEDIMDHVRAVSQGEDPVSYLMESAVDGSRMFELVTALCDNTSFGSVQESCWKRLILQDLISVAIDPLGYSPEIIASQLAIFSNLDTSGSASSRSSFNTNDPRTIFVQDTFMIESIFNVSLSRFPYETLPFLKLCKHLAEAEMFDDSGVQYIAHRLRLMDSFTRVASDGFSAYHTIREDENANLVSLEQTIDMYGSTDQKLLESPHNVSRGLQPWQISVGAIGQVVSESRPSVIMWYHQYSAIAFLGRWLELFQLGDESAVISNSESPFAIAPEVINLIATLASSTFNARSARIPQLQKIQNAQSILEEASDLLDRNNDIVTIVFDIFEQELQRLRFRPSADRSLDTILACARFMLALIDVLPGRIWPLIARSSLLNFHGRDGILLSIVTSLEAVSGDFTFLESCVSLFDALVEDAIRQVVSRRKDTTVNGPSESGITAAATTPTHVMEDVILSISQIMVEVLENYANWKFVSAIQKLSIHANILSAFGKIVKYVYGADDDPKTSKKLTAALSGPASYIFKNYRASDVDGIAITPLIQIIMEGLQLPHPLVDVDLALASDRRLDATLGFCLDLVRAGRLLGCSASSLESQLFNALPVLVRLFASQESHRLTTLILMHELADNTELSQSQSVLGHLGSNSSRSLLNILSGLGKPADFTPVFVAVVKLLTVLVSSRQQWFAICILTGSSPQASLRGNSKEANDKEVKLRGKPFLSIAMDYLSDLETLEAQRAIAMLEFVIKAQESWAWAATSLDSHPRFFPALTSFVAKINSTETPPLKLSYQNQIAALVANLCSVYLHCAKSNGDIAIVKRVIPVINWLKSNAVDVSAYNTSLHSNLRKNFSMKYPSCNILNFKHTAFLPLQFGENYFYDIYLATKMLSFDPSWNGKGKNQDQGFLQEFKRANLNLGLVQSQLTLLHSFKTLSVEHSAFFVRDREVQRTMCETVQNCLQANTRMVPVENIFETLFQTRIDFAVALIQRLVNIKAKGSEFVTLLPSVYKTLRFRDSTYELAITNNDLTYYRSMLTSLFLALQFHVGKRQSRPQSNSLPTQATATNFVMESVVLEVASSVIAHGFRTILVTLQDQAQSVSVRSDEAREALVGPKDLLLLLSILQSLLRLPMLPQMISQLSSVFISSDMVSSCLSLYSWSHLLTPPNVNEVPIYADLSLKFLVSLSSFPLVAEELAIEAVLSRLLTARITQILQSCKGGASPFDTRPHHQTLFLVWATGILPLCLNLLHSVGRPMAGEIAAFLNQFPQQLHRASNAFSYSATYKDPGHGAITVSLANEAAMLSLVSHILESYRAAGASAGVDALDIPHLKGYDENKKGLAEDLRELVGRNSTGLKDRIVATNEKELVWQKTKSGDLLEKKIAVELRSAILCLTGGQEDED